MLSVSRETCKWLQSLDLRVKNPKRDLSNGVIVGEIFSRYFPNQLNIDLFYSGSGIEQKQNNWKQLQKFFKKNEINIPDEAVIAADEVVREYKQRFKTRVLLAATDASGIQKTRKTMDPDAFSVHVNEIEIAQRN
ncbi:spermatogenesis-associated protein 4 [Podochytrium sp. JEL0797]|nr:spermatogenesis-associated protein 4 [Podochytrium sp. JEL0797]